MSGDTDNFASILPVRMDDIESLRMCDAIPKSDNWSPCAMRIVSDNGRPTPDISKIVGGSPVASSAAIEVLMPLMRDAVELLPLPPPIDAFKLVHVMDVVDCLNYDQSRIERYSSGGVSAILHYVFDMERLRGKHIFKIPEKVALEVFVSDLFRETVENHGLRGAIFRPFP